MRYISPLPGDGWQRRTLRTVSVLGSTGSIGGSALDVIRRGPDRFEVVALAGARNLHLLAEQAAEFRPAFLAVLEEKDRDALKELLPPGYGPEILAGPQGYARLGSLPEASLVLSAQAGAAGLTATMAAVEAGKVLALANKESLVLAGELIRRVCARTGAVILPVDSEHNAMFQCLVGQDDKAVARLILTASGGPFFGRAAQDLAHVTPEEALCHPRWKMGPKITIDSSTLMNKGLEFIEACRLFGVAPGDVDVLIHKESIVHSLVEYTDGTQLAHLGVPDMRIPIAYCLGWPDRVETGAKRLSLVEAGPLTFARPDENAFPCLGLAREALSMGRGATVVLNAANEVAVDAFLQRRMGYQDIPRLVSWALDRHAANAHYLTEPDSLESIIDLDTRTRVFAGERLNTL